MRKGGWSSRSGRVAILTIIGCLVTNHLPTAESRASDSASAPSPANDEQPLEQPNTLPQVIPVPEHSVIQPARRWMRGQFVSVQVNVDSMGNNVVGDAANEPSIAVDPTNHSRMAIGWRQFNSNLSDFREGGYGYTTNAGASWTFPGVIQPPGVFASDPVLGFTAEGVFYYNSLQPFRSGKIADWACYMYTSTDGGATWPSEVFAFGGDKLWMTVDRTGGMGHGHIYMAWSQFATNFPGGFFTRSTDDGLTYMTPIDIPGRPRWGTLTVDPFGTLYIAGILNTSPQRVGVIRSTNAQDDMQVPTFSPAVIVNLDGLPRSSAGPNPAGLLGQVGVASDHSGGPHHGNIYMLSSVQRTSVLDPLDVMFSRSEDGGQTWSAPVRVNDDALGAWQWFGTISVAPTGRIDVIWNDTRNHVPAVNMSELYYSYSTDAGQTWSTNQPLSPSFNSHVGWPQQNKLGDYYDMISDSLGADLAWAATFNGEQDVYYLRIGQTDCNENGVADVDDIALGTSTDVNSNGIPDECDVMVPAASTWGLIAMGGIMVIVAVSISRRRATSVRMI